MDFAAARRSMVENQLRTNRVTDPLIIAAMDDLPREMFVPPAAKGVAYVDEDLPLGRGRYLMEPLVLARLLQTAEIGPEDVALLIGSDAGYAAAVLARLASTGVAVESDAELAARTAEALTALGLDTVAVVNGPLALGYARGAPYDVIVFGGAIAEVPQAVADQLAEGGRMVAVVTGRGGVGKGTLFRRVHGALSQRQVFDAATPILPGFEARPRFVF